MEGYGAPAGNRKINQEGVHNTNRNNGSGVYMPKKDTLKRD